MGALLAGVLADVLGVPWAIGAIAALTFASGGVVLGRMYETLPSKRAGAGFTSRQAGRAPPARSTGGTCVSYDALVIAAHSDKAVTQMGGT